MKLRDQRWGQCEITLLLLETPRQILWDPEGQAESMFAGCRMAKVSAEPGYGQVGSGKTDGQAWVLSRARTGLGAWLRSEAAPF